MKKVYELYIYSDIGEKFFIGIFESHKEAKQVANLYLSTVMGFKDYPCKYHIVTGTIIGTMEGTRTLTRICAWNTDVDFNEIDEWQSEWYVKREDVKVEYINKKKDMKREQWSMDTYEIGKCEWTEGFIRVG